MVSIPSLTEVTTAATTEDVVIETAAGTRRMSRANLMLRLNELSLLTPSNISISTDRVGLWDATDNLLKSVTIFDLIFGNFNNLQLSDTVALNPALHNIRPLQLIGTFTTPNLTLSNVTSGMAGASFSIFNFSTTDVTVTALDSMTIFQNGAAVSPVTIRENTAATIQVNNAGNEAIFAGG